MPALKDMLKYTRDSLGVVGQGVRLFTGGSDYAGDKQLGPFLKVTNRGTIEDQYDVLDEKSAEAARFRLSLPKVGQAPAR
jgi:hypothetical protein